MNRDTTPGRIENLSPSKVLLYNFKVDGFQLKPQHQDYLRVFVAPKLHQGGSVSIVGLASRTGNMGHNERLSEARANSVLDFLRHSVPKGFPVREFKAFGERKARFDGVRNGVEDERYRSVVLFMSAGPQPPNPTLDPGTVLRELPLFTAGGGTLDTIGKILDSLSGAAALVNVVIDVIIIDLAGTILGIFSTVIGLPAAWLSGQAAAEKNGKMLGFSKALQKMADTFSDYDLRKVPESSWPALPHPAPSFSPPDNVVTVAERSARYGHRQGYEQAWAFVSKLEAEPRDFPVEVRGEKRTIKLSGRRYLWILSQAYHDDVWRKILAMLEFKAM